MSNAPPPALVALYYAYPAVIFLYFTVSTLIAVCRLQHVKESSKTALERPGRRITIGILGFFLSTYITQLFSLGIQSVIIKELPADEHIVINCFSCILVFGIQTFRLIDTDRPVWYPFRGSWILALAFETIIFAAAGASMLSGYRSTLDLVNIILMGMRFVALSALLVWPYLNCFAYRNSPTKDEERQSLLAKDQLNQRSSGTDQPADCNESGYGSTLRDGDSEAEEGEYSWERRDREARETMDKRLKEGGNWFEYAKGFKILFPYVWPVESRSLQLRAVAVFGCLLTSNALHLLIPRQTGIIMDSLNGTNQANGWVAVAIFAVLRLAASESGVDLVQQWLWTPIKYYSHEALSRAAYSHMMRLSADFHDSKSTSDMIMAIYGGRAISNAVENITLHAVPMLVDMAVAIVYLSVTFGPYEGLITVATGTVFLLLASRLVSESKVATRKRIHSMYQEHYIRSSGLQGWQTVSAFNQIGYEDNRHANAVTDRWLREQQFIMNWTVSVAFQTMVLTFGLLGSAFLAVYRIRSGAATPGQFAMLLMYWAQLTSPLQFFARLGKGMSDDFIDAERLLDIMKTKPSVESKPGARPLKFVAGEVVFENVCFSYDKQKGIIKNINFSVPAGETVAFVGATGAGKSTILKLLDRFYDVSEGCIKIDGQDIRDVDLSSLRERIGVVPQSPILFDDTIINNVRYGKIMASDEEVYEACRAACIHDKIEGFTHGYKTRVGERGVKLSGGELQRVAIARAILKKPDIVLLDEATSAVDTDTEQQIQTSFRRLCQGRTTFIVAHRLSTIMNADRIIVLEHGEIVEQGSHDELIIKQGRYADLWSKQVFLRPKDKTSTGGNSCKETLVDSLSDSQTPVDSALGTSLDSNASAVEGNSLQAQGQTVVTHKKEVESAGDESSLADSNSSL
ncbi:heavy metal tolerance protein [Stachybotrys elegans]|uniref:Heavy metal tolerance protein n=1 Tax=Stachybotrys elegans TaxID=80388 RepID=A0A8K0WM54_9HYPO|nr:heavy metal tolerance protein [Stachybotrys elegans]